MEKNINVECVEVDHKKLEWMIRQAHSVCRPIFVLGTTGIGKSVTVKRTGKGLSDDVEREYVEWDELSKKQKYDCIENPEKYFVIIDLRLTLLDPTDLRGIPALISNGKYEWLNETSDWKIPLWVYYASNPNAKGIIFLDELNLATPNVQTSAYQIVNDHQIGETPISKGISVIGAGNRKSDKANIFTMPKPLQNRFLNLNLLPPNPEDWIDWAFKNDVDMRIISFIDQRGELLFKFDPKSLDRAFPTPRAWGELCNDMIKNLDDSQEDFIRLAVASAVGVGTAHEFMGWLTYRSQVDLKEILDNPSKAKELNSADLKYALVSLVTEWYKKHNTVKDLDHTIKISKNLDKEFMILLLKFAKKADPDSEIEFVSKLKDTKEFKTIKDEVKELLGS